MDKTYNKSTTYLIFELADTAFGVNISRVIEVLRRFEITKVPDSIQTIKGIINFRGDILTICNIAKIMEINNITKIEKPIIIVFDYIHDKLEEYVGAIADKLVDVIEIKERDIKGVPEFGTICNPKYLSGLVKTEHGYIFLLDIEKIFSDIYKECLND